MARFVGGLIATQIFQYLNNIVNVGGF